LLIGEAHCSVGLYDWKRYILEEKKEKMVDENNAITLSVEPTSDLTTWRH
jgi:hypothetical protein